MNADREQLRQEIGHRGHARQAMAVAEIQGMHRHLLGAVPLRQHAHEPWPARPLHFVLPVPPGGGIDVVVARLNAELRKVLQAPDVRERLASAGFEAAPGTPAQLGTMIGDALERWGKLVPQLDLKPE